MLHAIGHAGRRAMPEARLIAEGVARTLVASTRQPPRGHVLFFGFTHCQGHTGGVAPRRRRTPEQPADSSRADG